MNASRLSRIAPRLAALAVALGVAAAASAEEKLPTEARINKLEARPASIQLKNPFEYTQLLLYARLETGDTIDVTRTAEISAPKEVKVSPTGLVRPTADGTAEITVSAGGQSLKVPVTVTGQKAPYAVSFVRDLMPAMSKLGCNAGTCHGSAEGKNGFKLSLRGYDPEADHRALTDELEGRRFNRAAPDRSLMLMKPGGAVPHVGGVVWQPGDPYYDLAKLWISQAVKLDLDAPRVASIAVSPQGPVVPQIGMRQQFAIHAKYTDGSIRDVTAEAFVESSNTEVATVDKGSLVTTLRRGEATMLARYEGAYAASTLVVMGDRSGFSWNNAEAWSWVDELVYDKLKKVKIQPSELCSDADFLRRVHIDLTGLPPTSEEVRAFLNDNRPTRIKRDEVIDKLVGSPDYIEQWTNKWADLLQVNRKFLGDVGAKALRDYIRKAVAENMPYDKFAYSILTGSGSNVENPTASYLKILRTPDAAMENTTHLFLAIRFNCNKCHDHPFERWTQNQYYNLAAYFAQVTRTRDPKYPNQNIGGSAVEGAVPLVEVIKDNGNDEVHQSRTGAVAKPLFPFTYGELPDAKLPRRTQLARWITAKENPYFAKSYVNRIWSYLVGVGIIEPVDDIRAGNPPTNPALLDRLNKEFIDSKFNVQHLMKTICKSRTYQLSITTNKWNEGDEINYSHALARRLPAEVLYDTIHRATGSQAQLPGLPPGARAAQLIDSNVPLPSGFLDLFGKPVRESACECERSNGMQLGPILNLVNGPIVADAVRDPNNRLVQLAAREKDDGKYIEEIYVSVLNRLPSQHERELGIKALRDGESDHAQQLAEFNKKLAAFKDYEKQLDARQADWEKRLASAPVWEPVKVTKAIGRGKGGPKLTTQKDSSILVTGPIRTPELYTITATTKLKSISGVRLEALPDDSLPAKGPGRAPNGNFVLNEFKFSASPSAGAPAKPIILQNAKATFSQDQWAVTGAIDGNTQTGWAVSPQFGKAHSAIFELKERLNGDGATLTFVLDQQFPGRDHNLGKFRISVTGDQVPRLGEALPEHLAKILATPADKRSDADKAELLRMHRAQDTEYQRLAGTVSQPPPADKRITGAQDLVWALINSPGFLFNH